MKGNAMDDGIYRMSLVETFLVLIVIGLWVLAVIHLIRKLDRICNPPLPFLNYSTLNNISQSSSALQEYYQNHFVESTPSTSMQLTRATSEPVIDGSHRTAIHVRSPSESGVHPKLPTSPLAREASIHSINLSPSITRKPPRPKRIPTIVKRSLLDLHRHALFSNTSFPSTLPRSARPPTDYRMAARFSLRNPRCRREDAIDECDWYKNSDVDD